MADLEPLSYDEIHAVQRRERSSRSLAKVPPDFYPRLSAYLAQARRELDGESLKGASPRVLLLQGQFRNLEETAREIAMLRLRKVSEMSFTTLEGGSLNEKALTPEELEFARSLLDLIGRARATTLQEPAAPAAPAVAPRAQAPAPAAPPVAPPPAARAPLAPPAPPPAPAAPPPLAMLRILDDIPPFEGENKHVYRLRKEDVVTLPRAIASILVRRKKAIEMESPA
jgi:DNA replication initiation complex subunit (GINS family)